MLKKHFKVTDCKLTPHWCRLTDHTCQLSQFSLESSSFSSNLPVFPVRAPNLPGNTYDTACGLFQNFFHLFRYFRDVKKENKTRSGIHKCSYLSCSQLENGLHSNQTDIYLTNIVIGQKSTNQIAQYMVESWCSFRMLLLTSGTFGRPSRFRHCWKRHFF